MGSLDATLAGIVDEAALGGAPSPASTVAASTSAGGGGALALGADVTTGRCEHEGAAAHARVRAKRALGRMSGVIVEGNATPGKGLPDGPCSERAA
jgi:hypothetical protein